MRPIGGIQLQSPILFPQGHEMAIGRYDKLAVSAHGHVLPVGSTDGFPQVAVIAREIIML